MRLTLAEGERVILRERPSARTLIGPLARVFLGAVAVGAVASLVMPALAAAGRGVGPELELAMRSVAVLAGLWFLDVLGFRRVRHWMTTAYVLTDERLIVRRGLGGAREDSVPLPAIYRVDIRQRLLQRTGDTGTLRFLVAQGSEFALHDVPHVAAFRAEVIDAVSKSQQRHWHRPLAEQQFGQSERGYA
ncbi:PH domain-containing protein [Falsarthrobacter nasiphocae]|uniref:Membrane protein YdbT with pleckstrin-like domain n=1 Tax=Falsarthrobacter nasiphocae TaxID=189863 RepID=A0AAE3YEY6_9MICC|nr:PH domain-containing protein [Falsarthrobacter nasiphocae]MDR6892593.1 putative membrane protein YdbT with pleckstrin-like domain [Falsarthrobacter nasiphocae]